MQRHGRRYNPAAMRFFILVLAVTTCVASAQTPPPVAPLPDIGALPSMPPDTRLPGPDPRQCGPSKFSALCAEGRWLQFSRATIKVTAPRFSGDYSLEQADNGELHVTYRERAADNRRGGEVVLFGTDGVAYRSRDPFPDPGSIIDYTTSNALMMGQLCALLLDLGVLGPPSDVAGPQSIKANNATQYLRTAAPRAALVYGAPWTMTGSVRRASADEIAFNLRLLYTPVDRHGIAIKGKTDSITLAGTVSYAPRRASFPDSFDLFGWKLMKLDAPLRGVATLGDAKEAIGP
jgi:hypothetical protein